MWPAGGRVQKERPFLDTGWPLGKGSIHHAGGCGLQVSCGPHWNIYFGALAATCIMQSYIS